MKDLKKHGKSTIYLTLIALGSVIWNLLGTFNYFINTYKINLFGDFYQDEEKLNVVLNTPTWVMASFCLAIIGGLIGSLLLLFRKKSSKLILRVSLIGMIGVCLHILSTNNNYIQFYGINNVLFAIVLMIGIFMAWYSQKADNFGWLS